jgi:hypothetical protein
MAKISREEQLKESLKRAIVIGKLYRIAMEEIRTSDLIKEWAKAAKDNKNKSFVDLRIPAANTTRSVDAMFLAMRSTMGPDTVRAIVDNMNGESVQEINILIEMLADIDHHTISGINDIVRKAIKDKNNE